METLRGTIKKIVYRAPADGGEFYIMFVRDASGRQISVKGNAAHAFETGQDIHVTGEMGEYRSQPQMQAGLMVPVVPPTNAGAHGWLKGQPIEGIADDRSEAIRAAFPDDLHEALYDEERLRSVEGIGKKLAHDLCEAWQHLEIPNELLELFNKVDLPMRQVNQIVSRLGGDEAMRVCSSDPWSLVRMVKGIGFKAADMIAQKFECDMECDERYDAALSYVMSASVEGNGHTQADRTFVFNRLDALGLRDVARVGAMLDDIPLASEIESDDDTPVVRDDITGFYAARHTYERERAVARRVVAALKGFNPYSGKADIYRDLIAQASEELEIVLDPSQEEAALASLLHRISVITGGPGTGKSTTQAVILRVIKMERELLRTKDAALADIFKTKGVAPTGRAADRLGEVTGHEGSTIHRALEYTFEGFGRDESNPLDEINVIADEFSMADVHLADALIRALRDGSRLVIVGDDEQLPSVGPGSVLGDMIRSGVVPVSRLNVIHRQAEKSGIIDAAYRVSQGLAPEPNGVDVFMIEADGSGSVMRECRRLIEETLPEAGLDPSRDMLLVTPQRKGVLGSESLNGVIKGYLNPEDPENPDHSQKIGWTWYSVGDRVMHLQNNLEKGVMNGAIGEVVRVVAAAEGRMAGIVVQYGKSHLVNYDGRDIKTLTHAWATTIHKVQGSEAPAVIHIVDSSHERMLERNLIYTGLTRGKRLLYFVGQMEALEKGCARTVSQRRKTGLRHMLRQAMNVEPYLLDEEDVAPIVSMEADVPSGAAAPSVTRRRRVMPANSSPAPEMSLAV